MLSVDRKLIVSNVLNAEHSLAQCGDLLSQMAVFFH